MSLELIPDSDPRLHTKTEVFNPHEWDEMHATVEAMFKLMFEHDGMGLAAPQVGINRRVFIMWYNEKMYVCINPRIEKANKGTEVDTEGCLSYPGQKYAVEREAEIHVSYQDLRGRRIKKKMKGLLARCFQHELDHLNGIVMLDRGRKV